MIMNIIFVLMIIGSIAFAIALLLGQVFYNDFVKTYHLLEIFLALAFDASVVALVLWLYRKATKKEDFLSRTLYEK
jgi:putative effector of murein hydrolase